MGQQASFLETVPGVDYELLGQTDEAYEAFQKPGSPVGPAEIFRDDYLSQEYGAEVWVVSELNQSVGAFKIRGAYNFMRQLEPGETAVTASEGNHGLGVAYSSHKLGIKSVVFAAENAEPDKIVDIERYGGGYTELVKAGKNFDETNRIAQDYCNSIGATFVPAFDHQKVIAGQGTLGREVLEKGIKPDTVILPVGGGGLIGGVGNVLKSVNKDVRLIGVEPEGAASMSYALEQGQAEELPQEVSTLIKGVNVRQVGKSTIELAQKQEVEMITVADNEVIEATSRLWTRDATERTHNMKAELAGSVAYAGLKKIHTELKGQTVVYLLSGGNLFTKQFEAKIAGNDYKRARHMLN